MLTKTDEDFIRRWEVERHASTGFIQKMLAGLPVAMLFGMPVIILMFLVQYFSPQWFDKASQVTQQTQGGQRIISKEFTDNPDWYNQVTQFSTGTFISILLAVVFAILFFAYFRASYKMELNEQLYRELKEKQRKGAAHVD